MNAKPMRFTHTAERRMAEVGVPPRVVAFLLHSGHQVRRKRDGRDRVHYQMPIEAVEARSLKEFADVEVIVDPADREIITVHRIWPRPDPSTKRERPGRRWNADRAEMSEQLRIYTGEKDPGAPAPGRSGARATESRGAVASGGPRGEGPSRMTTPAGAGGSHEAGLPASAVAGADTPAYHARPARVPLEELDAKHEPIEGFMLNVWLIEWAFAAGIVLVGLVVGWALTT